jgi:hypothetical protein
VNVGLVKYQPGHPNSQESTMSDTIPMTIEYNAANPKFVIKLSKGDSIVLRLATDSGFSPGSSIDAVTIYANKPGEKERDERGDPICGWRRNGPDPNGACTAFAITPTSGSLTEVTLEDTEETASAERHWFGVSGTLGGPDGKVWTVDPELINKPGG